jgi:LacI family transcriptional regulator
VTAVERGGRPLRPVTLADIARAAGTSPSTASRALSGRGYVSARVRDRLLAAAEELGYVPNASARALKQRQSRVVGVVLSDVGNPFYAGLASGIEQVLRDADYQMVLVSDNSDAPAELAGARTFLAMRAPGVIITPVAHEATSLLAQHGVAVVEIDRQLARVECDAVVVDNVGGARDATAHLLALGHRRIGLLVAATDWTSDAGRAQGYLYAHHEAGLPVEERLICRIPTHARDAGERIAALLDVEAPTALFAANNALAERAWHVLRRGRRTLPADVSLVAFDDVTWMEMVNPAITAVAQPTLELGRRAARLLLRRLADPDCERSVERLQPALIVRGSTARPAESRR